MGVYDQHLLPHVITLACGGAAMHRLRRELIPLARGRVLEVGLGPGYNLPYYDPARVTALVGLEPSTALLTRARGEATALAIPHELRAETLEEHPDAPAAFETIVFTYTLCTVPDAAAALAKARRLLAPGGQLLVCEHGQAPAGWVRTAQRLLQPPWGYLGGGCQLGRPVHQLLESAGFCTAALSTAFTSAFRPASYTTWGVAPASPRPSLGRCAP